MQTKITVTIEHDPDVVTSRELTDMVDRLVAGFYLESPRDDDGVLEVDVRHEGSVE